MACMTSATGAFWKRPGLAHEIMLIILGKKLVAAVLTLMAASVLIFAGTELLPGDLAGSILQNNATPETLAQLRLDLKLDQPATVRFMGWVEKLAHGDLGRSLTNDQDVATEIAPRLANTIFLATYAALVAVPLALGLGLITALYQGRWIDRIANVGSLMAISFPEYFLAYLLIKILAVDLGLLPSLANVAPDTELGPRLILTLLPMITLVLGTLAHMLRMTRTAVLSIMERPFIEMAILKGLPQWQIISRHALPNALAPIVSVIALNLGYLVVGVVVVETVFVYPGLGQLMVDAVGKHDVPVVQACGMIFATAFIGLNLLADMITIIANPRLRRQTQ